MQTYSGTSISAPLAAGAAALYLSQNPDASPSTVHEAIVNAASGSVTGPEGSSYERLDVSSF
jgi:subtilisin family serine protease